MPSRHCSVFCGLQHGSVQSMRSTIFSLRRRDVEVAFSMRQTFEIFLEVRLWFFFARSPIRPRMSTPGRQVRKPFGSDIGSNDAMRSASASPFVRSSSTPQRLYEAARNAGGSNGQASLAFVGAACSDSPTSFEHNSPFISRNSPVRRKNASLGSPGVRALANAANQTRAAGSRPKSGLRSDTTEHPKPHSGRRSAAFIRKKTFQQR